MAPTVLQAIASALALLVPLFALVLLVLAVSHPPAHGRCDAHRKRHRMRAVGAYIAIAVLAFSCAVAGALGLRSALEPARGAGLGRGEAIVEALVFLELGTSVLYLTSEYLIQGLRVYWAIALVIELVCASTVSLIYSPLSGGAVSPFLPPILSLLFTASVLPVLGFAMRVHMAKQSHNNAQTSPMTEIRTPSFSGTRLSVQSSVVSPPSSAEIQDKVSPQSSLSDITAVNHYRDRHGRDANTLESGAACSDDDSALASQIASSRSKSLLVFLIASQVAAFMALVLQIAAVKVGLSVSLNSEPSSATADTSAHAYAILQIFRSAFMVLCITGIMSALLLHTYNAYLHAAPIGRQSIADHSILPPVVDLSRMNAITVSLSTSSTTATTSPPLTATKKRSPGEPYTPPFDRVTKKFCFKSRFTDIAVNAVNTKAVFKGANRVDVEDHEKDRGNTRKSAPKGPLSLHGYSASYSSSFACPMAKSVPSNSMSFEAKQDASIPRSTDCKIEDDEDGEPGYAYIYTDGPFSREQQYQMDPLDVGRPAPFQHRQQLSVDVRRFSSQNLSPSSKHISLQPSHSDSVLTNHAVENSFSSTIPAFPPSSTYAPIEIPAPKLPNPYPTPRSTPTATAFADHLSSPDPPNLPIDLIPSDAHESPETRGRDTDRNSNCSSSTHIPVRNSTPTPTPTRAPTPGLSFTPFIGSHVRKRDSISSRSQPQPPPSPPSPSSAFIAHLKGRAKTLSSKHESISESLAQSFEGIRHGLGGSNGRTKYPLRSSTSQGSLGLGLGISSGFKFPQLTRRASELDKGSRNGSTSTLAVTAEGVEPNEEGDFMDLRDPFACPNVMKGGALRIVSQAELGLMGGRESRTGYRDDDLFELESGQQGLPSCGKARGHRMSAWGKLPMPPSRSSSASNSPLSMKQYHRYTCPTPSPTQSPTKSKHRSERKGKSKRKSAKVESSWSGGSAESAGSCSFVAELPRNVCSEDADFLCEEALIAQQLLMKLDEKLRVASETVGQR